MKSAVVLETIGSPLARLQSSGILQDRNHALDHLIHAGTMRKHDRLLRVFDPAGRMFAMTDDLIVSVRFLDIPRRQCFAREGPPTLYTGVFDNDRLRISAARISERWRITAMAARNALRIAAVSDAGTTATASMSR